MFNNYNNKLFNKANQKKMINEEIIKELRKDNKMSLELALHLNIPQTTLFARMSRKSQTFLNDIRVINFLQSKGLSKTEILETKC